MDFKALGIRDELLRALKELGFEAPMPIQTAALPELLNGSRDFIGLAQTGTGKTAAFGLPLLQGIDPALKGLQGVVLCPTRELCMQITDDLKRYGRYLSGIRVAAVYGGGQHRPPDPPAARRLPDRRGYARPTDRSDAAPGGGFVKRCHLRA